MRSIVACVGAAVLTITAVPAPAHADDDEEPVPYDFREGEHLIDPNVLERPGRGDAVTPLFASVPVLLGGTTSGKYPDGTDATFDGSGYTVVDIDGAFDASTQSIAGAVVSEACFGLPNYPQGSLCDTSNTIPRPLPENSGASYFFSNASGSSRPSNSPGNTCFDHTGSTFCHYFHGAITASTAVGKPLAMNGYHYTGAAPGSKLITLKIGGGSGSFTASGPTAGSNVGWPGQSIADALNYVNSTLAGRSDLGRIAVVTISTNGDKLPDSQPCPTSPSSAAVRINDAAKALKSKGIAVVMAAGNDTITGRGTYNCGDSIIRVGASRVTAPTQPTSYSNISPSTQLYAPSGEGVSDKECTTNRGDCLLVGARGNYAAAARGTSYSAPQVAGAFAVLRQKYGTALSVDQLVARLKATGTPLSGGRAGAATAGAAVINIAAALKPKVTRIAGADRYEQAAAISKVGFTSTAPTVYIASGENFPDALAAGAAAAKKGGPLLLTTGGGLPAATTTELKRLKPSTIVVAGGPNAVSDAVVTTLKSYAGSVKRISGADRYETSRKIAADAFPSASRVYFASGDAFPDAISAGGAAGAQGAPIILLPAGWSSLDSATAASVTKLAPTSARVVGGTAALPDSFLAAVKAKVPSTTRVAGAERWTTSANVNLDAFATASTAFLVSGLNFPDGLSAAPVAAKGKAPVFLSESTCIPKPVLAAISRMGVTTVTLAGGTTVLGGGISSLAACP